MKLIFSFIFGVEVVACMNKQTDVFTQLFITIKQTFNKHTLSIYG